MSRTKKVVNNYFFLACAAPRSGVVYRERRCRRTAPRTRREIIETTQHFVNLKKRILILKRMARSSDEKRTRTLYVNRHPAANKRFFFFLCVLPLRLSSIGSRALVSLSDETHPPPKAASFVVVVVAVAQAERQRPAPRRSTKSNARAPREPTSPRVFFLTKNTPSKNFFLFLFVDVSVKEIRLLRG